MLRLLLSFYILLVVSLSYGQEDPLQWRKDIKAGAIESQLSALFNLSKYYAKNQLDSAKIYAEKFSTLAKAENSKTDLLKSNWLNGYIAKLEDDYEVALQFFEQAEQASLILDDNHWLIQTYQEKGYIFSEIGNTSKAQSIYLRALRIADSLQLVSSFSSINFSLGELYYYNENQEKALNYFQRAKKFAEESDSDRDIILALRGISNVYSKLGVEEDNPESNYFDKALDVLMQTMQPKYLSTFSAYDSAYTFSYIGRLFQLKEDIEQTEYWLEKAIEVDQRNKFHFFHAHALNELTTVYKKTGQFQKALRFANKTKEVIEQNDVQQIYLKRNHTRHLAEIYAGLKEYDQAYQYYRDFHFMEKEIDNNELNEALAEQELRYQKDRQLLEKESEIQIEKQNREVASIQRNVAIIGFVLFVLFGFIGIKLWKGRRDQEALILQTKAEKLVELDRLKSRFFANISHELRTPLTLIIGPISALIKNEYGDINSKSKTVLATVKRNASKLLSLVEEILDMSKMESGKLELIFSEVHLYPFLNRLLSAFESGAQLRKIKFNSNFLFEENLRLLLDKNKLEKIINNLISNALKFTPSDGQIEVFIDFRSEQHMLEIKVKDNGRGISPKDLPHVFDRFFQSSKENAPVEGGTGIGLALAKEYTVLMGGNIEVKSTEGKGSIFTLSIPAEITLTNSDQILSSLSLDAGLETISETSGTSYTKKTYSILVVEDNEDMQNFIASIFSSEYKITQAYNGKEGLEILTNNSGEIDLIISDVMMPEMNGFEFLNRLKQDKNYLNIPVIMLTARAALKDKLHALTIGVDDYLTKPFEIEELRARVKNLITRSFNLQQSPSPSAPSKREITASDLKWLRTAEAIVQREIKNPQFNLNMLSEELAISDRQLNRRIKKITGLTPNKYFREIRLHSARNYLEEGVFETVAEVAYAVGFDTPHYFSTIYLERFGKKPSSYF